MTSLTELLLDQLDFHWDHQVRDRLRGLCDEEYLWEPVEGCWSLRRRGTATTPMAVGGGDLVLDYAYPTPDPAPVTTIAWRLAHVVVGVLAMRSASHFGAPPAGYDTWHYSATAAEALTQLDEQLAIWRDGVRAWGDAELEQLCGPAEGPFADSSRSRLVLHIHRELIHHLAEVALLRDLYAHR